MINRGALQLGVVGGIPVRVHWSFIFLLVWVVMNGWSDGNTIDIAKEILFVLLIFGCVVLHELGHALTAKRFGIKTRDIVLYPIGGIATLQSSPAPKAELWIALAGPAVNLLLAIAIVPFLDLKLIESLVADPAVTPAMAAQQLSYGSDLLLDLCSANIFLALFNMIPAMPMDGGRVLRAILAIAKVKTATLIATRVSQGLCLLLGAFALYSENIILVMIAVMVFFSAAHEHVRVQAHAVAAGRKVADVMTAAQQLLVFSHGTTVAAALNLALKSFQPIFPVVHGDQVLGVVDRERLIQEGAMNSEQQYISAIMERNFPFTLSNEPLDRFMERMQANEPPNLVVFDGPAEQGSSSLGGFVGVLFREKLNEFLLVRGLQARERAVATEDPLA